MFAVLATILAIVPTACTEPSSRALAPANASTFSLIHLLALSEGPLLVEDAAALAAAPAEALVVDRGGRPAHGARGGRGGGFADSEAK